jgi:hypothetical protein
MFGMQWYRISYGTAVGAAGPQNLSGPVRELRWEGTDNRGRQLRLDPERGLPRAPGTTGTAPLSRPLGKCGNNPLLVSLSWAKPDHSGLPVHSVLVIVMALNLLLILQDAMLGPPGRIVGRTSGVSLAVANLVSAMLCLSYQILTFYRDYNNGTLPSETWQRCKMTDDSQYRESR